MNEDIPFVIFGTMIFVLVLGAMYAITVEVARKEIVETCDTFGKFKQHNAIYECKKLEPAP